MGTRASSPPLSRSIVDLYLYFVNYAGTSSAAFGTKNIDNIKILLRFFFKKTGASWHVSQLVCRRRLKRNRMATTAGVHRSVGQVTGGVNCEAAFMEIRNFIVQGSKELDHIVEYPRNIFIV